MPDVVINLDEGLHAKLCALAGKHNETPDEALAKMAATAIDTAHFLQLTAPKDYFGTQHPVTDEEAEAALAFVLERLAKSRTKPRQEALIYGLMLAATEIAVEVCDAAGYGDEPQHGWGLAGDIFHRATSKLYRKRRRDGMGLT